MNKEYFNTEEILSLIGEVEKKLLELKESVLLINGKEASETLPFKSLSFIDERLPKDIHELNKQIEYYYNSGINNLRSTIAQLVQELYIEKYAGKFNKINFLKIVYPEILHKEKDWSCMKMYKLM